MADKPVTPLLAKTIYDFGMNNGDDVEYYLKKGFRVVAVEANPELCDIASTRFAKHIDSGVLKILNVALSQESTSEPVSFYVHKVDHVLSQLSKPHPAELEHFRTIRVPQRQASSIVSEFGEPHYIKIDIERHDHVILFDLFSNRITPSFISAESHTIDVLAILIVMGYQSFNLVDGATVGYKYVNATINTPQGRVSHSFNHHSAGPFGPDLISAWIDKDGIFELLAHDGLGWKDIHATNLIRPVQSSRIRSSRPVSLREHLEDIVPSFVRAIRYRLR